MSEECPHNDFEIYGSVEGGDKTIWFWERINGEAFDTFLKKAKGGTVKELIEQGKTTFPHPWAGECGSSSIKSKIKKNNMRLQV